MTSQEAQAAINKFYDALAVPAFVRARATKSIIAYHQKEGADQFANDVSDFFRAIDILAGETPAHDAPDTTPEPGTPAHG